MSDFTSSKTPTAFPRLAFVRHAETFANVRRVWHGQTDTALTPRGQEQAAYLGKSFHQFMQPDIIIASPLQRTRHTAQAIADQHQLPVQLDPRLMEFHLGDWEDTSFDDLQEKMGVAARLKDEPDFTPPNGDSQNSVRQRMVEAIEDILQQYAGANVVVVSHGVAIAIALAHYLHSDTTQWLNYSMNNTGISELCLRSKSLPVFNHTEHLQCLED
ncbi:histidine phosphatase family protein [Aestuariicella hydrocarbonica]|uniref:Histidine phosphatase family protein n=1 Tax=Pseudomaricurvus hydrocarbonicus TaxID=1470433 RepID=A0A9E5MLG0_9GAMM|nr:histidine phosphatase family protein [Aestuariicella hydrocarbonica]NHO64433.1 histidine phosphatase family protein [Aestuariicella hydrocarbonica]